ncbi:MAG: SpoIVB peptidase S55 domain-containing protein [Brevinematia bacterium]
MKKFLFFVLILVNLSYSRDYLTIDEIKPGMKGYGLSVFNGWEPEKFDVEIIDVIKNTSPGRSYILARLKGQNLEHSGVIAGMSGSPVYIDGKMVGAVAYTWSFSKDPICGITPLENMLEEDRLINSSSKDKEDKIFKKISTPVFVNGFSGFAKNYLEDFLKSKSLFSSSVMIESTKISGKEAIISSNLKPGDAVAINLIEGDLNVQGVGTVTYVRGNEVFIFGHPMDEAGKVSLPISRAYIFTVIPSSYLSFKIGASSEPIGRTVYDGQNAVYCKLGEKAEMIPFSVKVNANNFTKTYNFRVADNRDYFPYLSTSSIIATILNQTGFSDDKRVKINFSIQFSKDKKSYTISNEIFYSYYPSLYNFYSLANDLNSFFSIFYYNDISDLKIEKCNFEISIIPEIDYYYIDNAEIKQKNYSPGENLNVKVRLKRYKGDYINRNIILKIPDNIKNGQYNIIIASEGSLISQLRSAFPYYYSINNIEDLIYWGNYKTDDNKLVCALLVPKRGTIFNDKKLDNFPEIYSGFFQLSTEKTLFPEIFQNFVRLDATVFGNVRLNLTVGPSSKSDQKE